MPDFPLSQSPRTQGFQVQPGPEDEDELFTKGFTDLAYKAFSKQNPELLADVLTLRVLDTDASLGRGVGAFVLKHNQDVFYIPVVVSDNAIKPLDMFYSRRLDRYYPLTVEWLQEASRGQVNQLGAGVAPPKTLKTDVDIRNLVVPPTTGRYSYASENHPDQEVWRTFVSAVEKQGHEEHDLLFPQFLAQSPSYLKTAAAKFFRKNTTILKKFAEVYGIKSIHDALHTEKTAELQREFALKHDVFIASMGASPAYLKKELGDSEAGKAFQAIRTHGFYIKDRRPNTDDAFQYAQETLALTEPTASGFYRIFLVNGSVEEVLIVSDPLCLKARVLESKEFRGDRWGGKADRPGNYLVLFEDGRFAKLQHLIAEPVISASHEDVSEWVLKNSKERPVNDERGVLISAASLAIRATEPFQARSVVTKEKVTSLNAWGHFSISIFERLDGNTIIRPQDEEKAIFSKNYRWFHCREELYATDFLKSDKQVFMHAEWSLRKDGARKVTIKKAGIGFIVNHDGKVLKLAETVKKTAELYNISVPAAMGAVKLAIEGKPIHLWAVKKGLYKKAQGETIGGDPSIPPLQDPSMQQGAPPGPSGIELAVAEQMQLVQQQMAALNQQMQMLQTLQQRAQGIDQGGGAMAAPMGAATMQGGPPSLPGGQPAMAPMPQGGGDPSQGQGQPPPQGGGDPSQGQGQPPPQGGGDPSQGQGQPPPQGGGDPSQGGMDPSQGQGQMGPLGPGGMQANGAMPPQPMQDPNAQPPPPPVMTEDPSPDNIASQINPAFLDQAGELQQNDVFDAAAIASLAQNKLPKELIQTYLPTLDRAIDNLGRILLLYYLKETDIKEQIGNDQYTETEQSLRDVFRGLGDSILRITQESDHLLPNMAQTA